MSIKYLTYAFDARVSNPLRKLVLLKLCDNANDDGECWPSFGTVAAQCEMSRSSAIRHVQALIDDGFLSSHSRFKDGEQTSNMYKISKEKLLASGVTVTPPSVSLTPPLVSECNPPSVTVTPRTVTEPSLLTVIEPIHAPQADAGLFAGLDDSTTDNKKPTQPKFKPESLAEQMPPLLAEWWIKWVAYRRERKLTVRDSTMRLQAENLSEWGKAGHEPWLIIKASIENGWQGLFEPKQAGFTKPVNGGAAKLTFTPTDYENGINPDGSF